MGRPRQGRSRRKIGRAERLARLSVLVALGKDRLLRQELAEAIQDGILRVQIREILLQSYLFVGYPRMINAFLALEAVDPGSGGRRSEGEVDRERLHRRGLKTCRAIYGPQMERMLARMKGMHPDLPRWIVTEGYGKVLGRPGLSVVERELAIIPVLALQGVRLQMDSHLRGALRLGVKRGELRRVLEACADLIPVRRLRAALERLRLV